MTETVSSSYDYRNAAGALLYQVIRFAPKRFSQRRPDGRGGWLWNLDGVDRVPYRLPELLAARGRAVAVVEGERDCDRLHGLGIVATTNSGGAGKWRSEFASFFHGVPLVAVITDNDAPGRDHARQVADALVSTVPDVRIVELPGLPEHGDLCDWLDQGHCADDLKRAISTAPRLRSAVPA